MEVTRIVNEGEMTVATTSLGVFYLWGKKWILTAGVTLIRKAEGGEPLLIKKVNIPGSTIPGITKEFNVDGTTDPLLLCISRNGHTARSRGLTKEGEPLPIPTEEDVKHELERGMDSYGGLWYIPIIHPITLEDAIKIGRTD